MAILRFSDTEFLILAQNLAGRSEATVHRTKGYIQEDRVKDFAYACPKTIEQLFLDIQDPTLGDACIKKPKPNDLIWALHFLKKYPTAKDLANRQDGCVPPARRPVRVARPPRPPEFSSSRCFEFSSSRPRSAIFY
jgi:hypothetical protein